MTVSAPSRGGCPLSQGATEKGREERAQGEVLLMKGRASSECASVLKREGRCADKAGVLLMTVSAPSRGGLPPVSGGNREREGGVRAQGEVLLMKGRASSECASVLKREGRVCGQR